MPARWRRLLIAVGVLAGSAGCQYWLNDADRQVYDLIERRQAEALAIQSDANIGPGDASVRPAAEAYDFVPDPVDPAVPEAFARTATSQPADPNADSAEWNAPTVEDENGEAPVFALHECLNYAVGHSREYQDAKEELYLDALSLTLERHLWTPQWVASLDTRYVEVENGDRTWNTVANVAVSQRLPYGGEVAARVIDTLIRDVRQQVTTAETGQVIVEGTVPLLRGAGKVAYESRYQAERDLVYAVRGFERFRRTFAVSIASSFFRLLALRQAVTNAELSAGGNQDNYERTLAMFNAGRTSLLDVQRAEQQLLSTRNSVINSVAVYESSLDQFKVRLGMPLDQPLQLADEQAAAPLPDVTLEQAIEVALKSRLDLVTSKDQIDDAAREVANAKNNLLPDLDVSANFTRTTEPGVLDLTTTEHAQNRWEAGVTLDVPIDRVAERNRYRRAQVLLNRAMRDYGLAEDQIRQEVREAIRRIEQARANLRNEKLGVDLAVARREYAQLAFEEGLLGNRDVVEAEEDLLSARNGYAAALAELRVAGLDLRRDTGTMRIDEHGYFEALGGAQ